jgi:hypothetical protein
MNEKLNFTIEKEINGKKYVFECVAEVESFLKKIVRVDVYYADNDNKKDKTFGRFFIDYEQIICLAIPLEIQEKKYERIRIDAAIAEKLTNFFKEREEIYIKEQNERKKRIEEEFNQFLQDNNYLKNEVLISQSCDTGNYNAISIDNEKIKDFVNRALNKFLHGVIFEKWYPDYYLTPKSAIYFVDELIQQVKARRTYDNGRTFLAVSAEIVNQIANLLKEEERKKEEEKKKEIEELKQKIKSEGKVLLKKWSEPCYSKNEKCDVDVHYVYAFVKKEDAEKFAEENNIKKIEHDEVLEAYTVHTSHHTF